MERFRINDFEKGSIVTIIERDGEKISKYTGTIIALFNEKRYLRIAGEEISTGIKDIYISNILDLYILGFDFEDKISINNFRKGDIISIEEKDYDKTLKYKGTIIEIFEEQKYLRISGREVPTSVRDVHISNILERDIIGNAYENMRIE